jgi:hypothetical protein
MESVNGERQVDVNDPLAPARRTRCIVKSVRLIEVAREQEVEDALRDRFCVGHGRPLAALPIESSDSTTWATFRMPGSRRWRQ